ncbi:E3 ubiquitin ligase PQT3-like [Setaria viridis]|uniref:E3 ubiquitin ligase PQT3-like n=1 Tax=Setaria viridis TaxID=4556 RepID=UPI003B3A5D8C
MAVYYRYKSGVQTFSVPMAAPSVSIADLKNLILRTARHGDGRTRGRGPRESVMLYDARTGEEHTDGGALVPRSSTVLVRRVAGPPADAIAVAPSAVTSSSSAEDDEDRAISAVIDAAQLKWEGHHQSQGGRRYDHRGGLEGRAAPPAGYVCHRCRVPGHFIQHCPINVDPRYDLGRASSNTNLPTPTPVSTSPDDKVPRELHCKICSKVMADAVVASRCCFGSFCNACIRGQIAAKSRCACGAQSRADDLIPNLTLRATIAKLLATSAGGSGSAGTSNRKSSAGSNAEPTSQSAAASQESHSRITANAGSEHSEGSAAPRTKQTTAETGAHAGYPEQYGYGNPFGPACYDPSFAAAPWACDPYMYYGIPYAGGYTNVPVPVDYQDGCHGRKGLADGEFQRQEASFKRRCGGRSEVAF